MNTYLEMNGASPSQVKSIHKLINWGWPEFRKAAIGNFDAIISNRV